MSYLVLARKWRPMTFEQVIDQKHVVVTLQNAIKNNRLANAYLFAGPRGVGKTTVARILAKAINCQDGPTIIPCNTCPSCTEITDGRSLDVLEIDGASNRGIDEVRNLRENVKYAPTRGKHKIYIIDEVHMLTDPAFNALLKTLEEPPSKVMFIFATTEPHRILATILSRCQRFDFKRITHKEIMDHLKGICAKESIDIDEEALHLIANKSDGSMRDAQSLLDQIISYCGEKISGKQIFDLLGIIDQDIYFRLTDIIQTRDKKQGLAFVDEIFLTGLDFNEFLSGLNEHLRNILILKTTSSADTLNVTDHIANKYQQTISQFQEDDLLRLIQIVSETDYGFKRSTNPRLKLELAIMKMISLDRTRDLADLIEGIHELKKKIVDSKANIIHRKEPITAEEEKKKDNILNNSHPQDENIPQNDVKVIPITLEDVKNIWSNVIDEVKKNKIALGSFLNEGFPSKLKENTLTIAFGIENGFHIKSVMANYKIIENILSKFLDSDIKIICIKEEKPANHPVSSKDYLLTRISQRIPQIQTIIEVFDGELIH